MGDIRVTESGIEPWVFGGRVTCLRYIKDPLAEGDLFSPFGGHHNR